MKDRKITTFFTLAVVCLGMLNSAHALTIAGILVDQPFNYNSTLAAGDTCLSSTGLACAWKKNDPLTDPVTGLTVSPLPSGNPESPYLTRAAIYTATGTDPGELYQVTKVDGGPGALNGSGGLTLYDEFGQVLTDIGDLTNQIGNATRGFWSYSGERVLQYLTVKPGTQAMVWEIEDLIIGGPNDNDSSTALVGFWDLETPYLSLSDDGYKENGMSHISLYGSAANQIPAPSSLLLVCGLLGALGWRRQRR